MHDEIINRRYQVKRKLGQGGMGMVYLVEDTHREDLPMALKTMISKDIDEGFLDAFRQEFAELAKLRHPNVAAAYDFGRISGTHEHFFTTEFVDGTDLYKGTKRESFDQLLDITIQLSGFHGALVEAGGHQEVVVVAVHRVDFPVECSIVDVDGARERLDPNRRVVGGILSGGIRRPGSDGAVLETRPKDIRLERRLGGQDTRAHNKRSTERFHERPEPTSAARRPSTET